MKKFQDDKPKSLWTVFAADSKKVCIVDDCNNPVTNMKGKGSKVLCREHQILQSSYEGGVGRIDRPHTFHREWVCDVCKYDPRKDEARFGHITDPETRSRAMRAVMHGDHITLKSMGGKDSRDNISTKCAICDQVKTVVEEDYLGPKKRSNKNEQ